MKKGEISIWEDQDHGTKMPAWSEDRHTPDSTDDAPGREPGPRGGRAPRCWTRDFLLQNTLCLKGLGFLSVKAQMGNKTIYTHISTHYFENGFPDFTSVFSVQGQMWCVWLWPWLEAGGSEAEWSSGVGFGAELASMPCQIEILTIWALTNLGI